MRTRQIVKSSVEECDLYIYWISQLTNRVVIWVAFKLPNISKTLNFLLHPHNSQCSQEQHSQRYSDPSGRSVALPNISQALRPRRNPLLSSRFAALQRSFLSTETRAAIDGCVAKAPVVLFMKGTPETPQCGFSRTSIQILGLQGVDPKKFAAFNVLEDEELRQGEFEDYRRLA